MTERPRATSVRVTRATDDDRPFVTRRIAGETIIVPVCRTVADLGAIYSLNEVASLIWQLIDAPTPVEVVVARIGEEFDVSPDQAAADVTAFLDELAGLGLVRYETSGDGR